MISLGSTTISAAAPWVLAAIPLATALLVYAYRKKGVASQQVVSSLFLLRSLPRATPGKKRFVPPLQFWIELALFLLLTCAAATVLLSERGRHIAVVIDNSLSMSVLDSTRSSRLERAKSLALADIAQALPPVRFSLFTTNATLEPASERGVSTVSGLAALPTMTQSFSADKVSSHLESLLGQGAYDAVWLYTDHPLQEGVVPEKVRVVTLPEEQPAPANIWITDITPKRTQDEVSLAVTTNLSGAPTVRAALTVTCYGKGASFALPSVSIVQQSATPITTRVGPLPAEWSHCQVNLGSVGGAFTDALTADNEGWIAKNISSTAISIVGALSPEQLGLSSLKNFNFSLKAAGTAPTIYHRTVPPTLNRESALAASLVVYPPVGDLPWGGSVSEQPSSAAIEITRWEASHPLLKYIKPTLLRIPAARTLTCPDSSTAIAHSRLGPIACAGEYGGARYAIVGFELFPFDGRANPVLSIFTLNLFSWLFNEGGFASSNKQPGLLSVSPQTVLATYIAPTEERLTISAQHAISALRPGVLEIERKESRDLLAINAFSDDESMLTHRVPVQLPETDKQQKRDARDAPMDLTPFLALAALLLLAVDLLRRVMRKQRWVAS